MKTTRRKHFTSESRIFADQLNVYAWCGNKKDPERVHVFNNDKDRNRLTLPADSLSCIGDPISSCETSHQRKHIDHK